MRKIVLGSVASLYILMMAGCSLSNPFGVGYDTSVCESTKDFGVCGSPRQIYENREILRKVQYDYLHANLDTELFFAIDKSNQIMVKEDRDGKWELYEISKWKTMIDENLAGLNEKVSKNKAEAKDRKASTQISSTSGSVDSDGDLSIKYQAQGPLIISRTNVGDIIRDNGIIQQAFIANYTDNSGDLISSHEVYIVAKESSWVVGESTPKETNLKDIPTPMSTELLKKMNVVDKYQEGIVDRFNVDDQGGVAQAIQNDPKKIDEDQSENLDVINSFIKKGETK
jgi:hypothetical protein